MHSGVSEEEEEEEEAMGFSLFDDDNDDEAVYEVRYNRLCRQSDWNFIFLTPWSHTSSNVFAINDFQLENNILLVSF